MARYDIATFTPAEAAKISGVSVTLQRDWRRREILPKTSGHARFTAFEVGEMLALNAVSAHGSGPLQFKPVARLMGAGIVSAALSRREAYSGAFDTIIGPGDFILEQLEHTHPVDFDFILTCWRTAGPRQHFLRLAGHQPSEVLGTFIRWAEGSYGFYPGPITPFETIESGDPRLQGAIMILDLDALGALFVQRAGKFVEVSEDAVSDSRPGPKRLKEAVETVMARRRALKEAS